MNHRTLLKEFIQYVSLNVCGMIGLSCYILADTFFVANGLGADGLTALNLAIPIYSFVHGCGLMLGMGGATKYSIFKGQEKDKEADQTFTNALCLALIFAVVFILVGILFSSKIALLLGADGKVFDMTKTYLKVILLFSPAFMLNDVFICFVRNDGKPKLAMTAMLTGSLSNILLDYLFIFPLQMGILGAVLATGFAPIISMCILSSHRIRKQHHFHLLRFKLSFDLTARIISLGIPSLVTEVASGTVIIVFNTIILRLQGNVGVAAYGVIANLSLVVTAIYTGIAQGMQPLASHAYGNKDKSSINKILKYALVSMLFLSVCIYLGFLSAAEPIASIFNSEGNAQLQQIAVYGLKLYFAAIPFAGFNIILSTYFTATEKALPGQIISLLRGFVIILPMAFLLSFFFGMTGIWLSYPVTEGIVAVIGVLLLLKYSHKLSAYQ
ncbi:MAG: MATE family efflux transporter [Lachnospiraceae bacterium]|nr:MATE family efflux transporter [Lachnospiraceae bacterium]